MMNINNFSCILILCKYLILIVSLKIQEIDIYFVMKSNFYINNVQNKIIPHLLSKNSIYC